MVLILHKKYIQSANIFNLLHKIVERELSNDTKKPFFDRIFLKTVLEVLHITTHH